MYKNYLKWFAAVTAAATVAVSLSACDEDTTDDPVIPPPSVELTKGEATATTLTFTLTPAKADNAAYVCIPATEAVPDAAAIYEKGIKVGAESKIYKAENLTPETEYLIAAASAKGEVYSAVVSIKMTTLAVETPPEVHTPNVVITPGTVTENSLAFTITPSDAKKAAYGVYPKGAPMPDAATLLNDGTALDVTKANDLSESGLTPETTYVIAAAASYDDVISQLVTIEMTTSASVSPTNLYEALQGSWTATMTVLTAFGQTGTKEMTWDTEIVTGVNEVTTATYSAANRLCCTGDFIGLAYQTPDDLLAAGGYWATYPEEANNDWGPKWFLEIADDGSVTVPASVPYYLEGDNTWSLRYYGSNYDFLGGLAHEGVVRHKDNMVVTVSSDLNTITVEPWQGEDADGNTLTFYVGVGGVKSDGGIVFYNITLADGSKVTSIGASALVLTRKSNSSADAPRNSVWRAPMKKAVAGKAVAPTSDRMTAENL